MAEQLVRAITVKFTPDSRLRLTELASRRGLRLPQLLRTLALEELERVESGFRG